MALTHKQQVFVNEYLKCWNATEAARIAGYKQPNVQGSQNLAKLSIKAEIDKRLSDLAMPANEVVYRIGKQAKSSLGDFVNVDDNGNFRIALNNPGADLSLIKKLKHKRTSYKDNKGQITHVDDYYEFELHDAQSALIHLDKRFSAGEPIQPQETINYTPDQWRQEQERRRKEAADTMSKFDATD